MKNASFFSGIANEWVKSLKLVKDKIMKNKIVVLLLAMSMTASIVGCGGNTSPADTAISTTETEESSVVVETNEADHVEESDSVAGTLSKEDSEENATTNEDEEIVETDEGEGTEDVLSNTQRNSVNMLNYMTVLTQRVNIQAHGSFRGFLHIFCFHFVSFQFA